MKIDIVRGMLTEYNNIFVNKLGQICVLLDSFDGEEGRFLTYKNPSWSRADVITFVDKFSNMTPLDEYLQDMVYRYEPNKNL